MITCEPLGILVIEDDVDTRENLRDILELNGHRVETAASAADTFAKRDWSSIAVVILDRKLPDGTAAEILPRLRIVAPQAYVVVATGYAELDDVIAALRQGAADYLLKPIQPDILRAAILRVAKRRQLERDKQRAEEQAVQAQRLAAVGEAMTGLIHESRNALQRSKACLEMLALEVEDRPTALDLVARTQRAQEEIQRLYEEVRQYAAPLQLHRESTDLCGLCRTVWHDLAVLRDIGEVSLVQVAEGVDGNCNVDRFAVGQVWRNILENAIQASPRGGRITVHHEPFEFEGRSALKTTFRDEGPGLNNEQQDRIFEPFFTTKSKGTGLGMAIAQRIVQAHGGQIAVGASTGAGAEVVVILPRDRP